MTAAAQRVSNGNAQLALELVGFNQDLAAAMQYVFGNAFVCKVRFGPPLLLGMSISTSQGSLYACGCKCVCTHVKFGQMHHFCNGIHTCLVWADAPFPQWHGGEALREGGGGLSGLDDVQTCR